MTFHFSDQETEIKQKTSTKQAIKTYLKTKRDQMHKLKHTSPFYHADREQQGGSATASHESKQDNPNGYYV